MCQDLDMSIIYITIINYHLHLPKFCWLTILYYVLDIFYFVYLQL